MTIIAWFHSTELCCEKMIVGGQKLIHCIIRLRNVQPWTASNLGMCVMKQVQAPVFCDRWTPPPDVAVAPSLR